MVSRLHVADSLTRPVTKFDSSDSPFLCLSLYLVLPHQPTESSTLLRYRRDPFQLMPLGRLTGCRLRERKRERERGIVEGGRLDRYVKLVGDIYMLRAF